jgi:tetratricopeptide (TPR) repeat protein
MQYLTKLFLAFFLIFWIFQVFAEDNLEKIQKADTLFSQKKYTQALAIYESVYNSGGDATPQMFLKMAFVYEGLKDYTKALYYLNLYYRISPNDATLVQMESLAQQHRLKGYTHSDLDFIRAIYERYFNVLIFGVVFCLGLIWSYIWSRRQQRRDIPIRYKIVFMLLIISTLIWVNLTNQTLEAVVSRDNTYLMSDASAGSELIKIIGKGHKVRILSKTDIWYKIRWDNQIAYVRENNLLLIKM